MVKISGFHPEDAGFDSRTEDYHECGSSMVERSKKRVLKKAFTAIFFLLCEA